MKIHFEGNFSSAHKLEDYEGECRMLHGHRFLVEINVMGETDNRGIVVDFKDLKAIISSLDHRTILKYTEENIKMFQLCPKEWFVWVEFNPTAENLASYLKQQIEEKYPNLGTIQVQVWENPKNYAEV